LTEVFAVRNDRLAALLLAAALLLPVPGGRAWAQVSDERRLHFDLPAGGLEDALNSLARQAGITLSFDPALVRDRHAPALKGDRTASEGLAELLAPHRLEVLRGSQGAYSVQRAAAPDVSHGHLAEITVTADAEHVEGPIAGYVARSSSFATGTDTPLIETPRSISVVTRDQMDDQAARTAAQSLRYSAGVLTEVTGHDLRFDSTTVRGFAPDQFLDGSPLLNSSIYSGWLPELQGMERVELVKGPLAALQGQASTGGAINMISKRPSAQAIREIGLSVGNHGRRQGTFDLGGALNEDASLMFRLNGLGRVSGGQTDDARDDRAFIAPSLAWKPTSRTMVTLLADATRDRATPKSAWPEGALISPNPHGGIPVSRYVGEAASDHFDRDSSSLAYLLEHRFDDRWTLRQNARYSRIDLDYLQVYGKAFREDMRTLDRRAVRIEDRSRTFMLDNQFTVDVRSGPVDHQLLLGLDFQRHASRMRGSVSGDVPAIDAFGPAIGTGAVLPDLGVVSGGPTQQVGFYAQDQMRWNGWTLGLGLRRQVPWRSAPAYDASLLYLSPSGLAPFASYSSAAPPGSTDNELGKQFELGLKYKPTGSNALFTLSAFELRKQDTTALNPGEFEVFNFLNLTGDPYWHEVDYLTNRGDVRTRGFELEARADLTRQFKLLGSYSFLDARITRSYDSRALDKQLLRTARHTASLWFDYRFDAPWLQDWSVGGGIRYVGKVPADIDNSLFNPAYTLADAAVRYERGPYAFALNANNLFDKTYVTGSGRYFGQKRTLQAKLSYRW